MSSAMHDHVRELQTRDTRSDGGCAQWLTGRRLQIASTQSLDPLETSTPLEEPMNKYRFVVAVVALLVLGTTAVARR